MPQHPPLPSPSQPPEQRPKPNFWQWLTGKQPLSEETVAPPEPAEEPTFLQRLLGLGSYMNKTREIMREERQQYKTQRRRLIEDLRRQRELVEQDLAKRQQKIYGREGYQVSRYYDRLDQLARHGAPPEKLIAVERLAERAERKAAKKFGRMAEHAEKTQRLIRRQNIRELQKQRDFMVQQRLQQLRLESRPGLAQPPGTHVPGLSPVPQSKPARRKGVMGHLFS